MGQWSKLRALQSMACETNSQRSRHSDPLSVSECAGEVCALLVGPGVAWVLSLWQVLSEPASAALDWVCDQGWPRRFCCDDRRWEGRWR